MNRPRKSHWDFGELFSNKEIRQVITVSELNSRVKRVLETNWSSIWVSGEITNFRAQSSGHCYFSLKDSGAQVQCVCFRGDAARSRQSIEEGQQVIVQGDITVYEPRGQYQMVVKHVEPAGQGALRLAFERLKEKLKNEGLFETARKRAIPRFPERVGLVTSRSGAAIQDILQSVGRRNPGLEIILASCRVQGEGAAFEIADRIRWLNEWVAATGVRLDVILVVRGGGSLEDLWAFNEEEVARAVAQSAIPIVSGVGHETDITICDLVADLRAATPTAAAEIVTEGVFAIRGAIPLAVGKMSRLIRRALRERAEGLRHHVSRLGACHPRKQLQQRWQRLDDVADALRFRVTSRLRETTARQRSVAERFLRLRPGAHISREKNRLKGLSSILARTLLRSIEVRSRHVAALEERLRLLSPHSVLARGYSITRHAETRRILRSPIDVEAGTMICTMLATGEILSVVQNNAEVGTPFSGGAPDAPAD